MIKKFKIIRPTFTEILQRPGSLKWVIVSLFLHLIFIWELPRKLNFLHSPSKSENKYVKLSFNKRQEPKALPSKEEVTQSTETKKHIIETKFEKTEQPKDAQYLSHQDHQTKKETISRKQIFNLVEKGLDPQKVKKANTAPPTKLQKQAIAKSSIQNKSKSNELSHAMKKTETKNIPKLSAKVGKQSIKKETLPYQEFLQKSLSDVSRDIVVEGGGGGYQENLSKLSAAEGDVVDLNTREYRYMGYFINLRKAIELAWNYPMKAAENGWSGCVDLKFSIDQQGKLKDIEVLGSSGYPVLDNAIVSAIKLASPFAPLPKGISKEVLNITGSFDYVLHGI